MYFGPSISVGRRGVSYGDSDAQAFIAATGLTGTTEVNAVNNLVANLKSYGLWSKMKAIYPFVSDTVNLLSYSEDFTNAAWSKNNITVTGNTTTAPNGTTTADTITDNSTSGLHQVQFPITTTVGAYTISCYAKAGTLSYIGLFNNSSNQGKFFNLSNGTTAGNIVAAPTSTTIQSVGNGWYRFSITTTTLGSNSNWQIIVSEDGINYSYSGTGKNAYIWGAQLDAGTTATTYQPIATTPANRFVSQFKYNLKDARDLDAAFRLAFNGTWTYSKQGATPNGSNAYANTYLVPNTYLSSTSNHLSFYSRTQASTYSIEVGCEATDGSTNMDLILYHAFLTRKSYVDGSFTTNEAQSNTTNTLGYQIGSRTASNILKLYWNNSLLNTNTNTKSVGMVSSSLFIGATQKVGASGYSNKQVAFSTIGDGLTDTEATNLYTSVQLFQQELSRYVGVPIVSDANAQAFLDAAVITDQTQANAVNTLVTDLKTYGLWAKMKAIYPFVGGTATTHKWNLKDPRDLDAAYRLAFSGAWTHSSTGALPNGANAYADSFFIPSTALTLNSSHLGFYSRTNNTTGIDDLSAVVVGDTQNMRIIINLTGSLYVDLNSATERVTGANANSTGFYQASRTSSTSLKVYKNNTTFGTNTSANTGTLPIISMYIGAAHRGTGAINYSNRECAFATLGDGLSDTEAANLYTAVNKFQTSLSRNV